MNVDPEDLLPKLPRPQDLQPFPSVQSLVRYTQTYAGRDYVT